MSRTYTKRTKKSSWPTARNSDEARVVETADVLSGRVTVELPVSMAEVIGGVSSEIERLAGEAGLLIMPSVMNAEVESLAGPKGRHDPNRQATRWTSQQGFVVLGGKKVNTPKPRVRSTNGHEVALTSYARFQSPPRRQSSIVRKLIHGISTRKYPRAVEDFTAGYGISKSAVSRELVVATEIITDKYGYHLPVYRQQDLFAGSGWTPGRSTLLNILTASAFVIEPLVAHFKRAVLADDIVGTDDTRVTLILPETIPKPDPNDPKSQRTYEVLSDAAVKDRRSVTARMWAYRGITVPLNVFDFTGSRHRDGPELMLADFEGVLQADCYAGYEGIALSSDGRIRRASCVAHARRKVFDAKESYPLESAVVLAKFQELYDIEDQAKALSPEDRLALRQSAATPVWEELKAWLDGESAIQALPKSPLGKALGYLRNHWNPLQTYLTDGRIPIDNNDVEQLMKQVALGRKSRVGEEVTPLAPHRPGRADFPHPVPHCSGSLKDWRSIGERFAA